MHYLTVRFEGGHGEPQLSGIAIAIVSQGNVISIDAQCEMHALGVLRVGRYRTAEPDLSGIETSFDRCLDGPFGSGPRWLRPCIIAGPRLNPNPFACARDAEFMEFAVPVARLRIVADLIAGASVRDSLPDGGANILAARRPSPSQSRQIVKRCTASDSASASDRVGAAKHDLRDRINRSAGPVEHLAQ